MTFYKKVSVSIDLAESQSAIAAELEMSVE